MMIVPEPIGTMDVRRVCATIREMTHGVMERKVLTMTTITRKTERTHLVIAIGRTGNVIPIFFQSRVVANGIGSVRVDKNVRIKIMIGGAGRSEL